MGKGGTAAVGQLATRTLAESDAVSRDKVKMAIWTGNASETNCFMNTHTHASVMVRQSWCTHAIVVNLSSRHEWKTVLHSSWKSMYCQYEHPACCALESP
jgi:hypothetical protein